MNQISRTLWVGLAINILATTFVFITSYMLNAKGSALDFDLWSLTETLNIVKYMAVILVIFQFLNVAVILRVRWLSLFTSFVLALLFLPAAIVYYIGCLFSIQNGELSAFERWEGQYDPEAIIANFAVKKRLNKSVLLFALTGLLYLLIPALSVIALLFAVVSGVSFFRAEKQPFVSMLSDGFVIMPDLFGYPVFIRSSDIKHVSRTDSGAIIETTRGNIKLKRSLFEQDTFERVFAQLSLSVLNYQHEASSAISTS